MVFEVRHKQISKSHYVSFLLPLYQFKICVQFDKLKKIFDI